MPLPKPHKGEQQSAFISRCAADVTMNADFPDNQQRIAVCHNQWREAHGGKPPAAASPKTIQAPTPNEGESASTFHDRCMSHPSMTQYKDEKFRAQLCDHIWSKPKPAAAPKAMGPMVDGMANCMPDDGEDESAFMDRCQAGGDTQEACQISWDTANQSAGKAVKAPPPKPMANEGHSQFMDRCMTHQGMMAQHADHPARSSVCQQMWDDMQAGMASGGNGGMMGHSVGGTVTKSTVRLNSAAESKARGLIGSGKVNNGAWSFSGDDGNALLGGADGTNWANYASYFLGEDTAVAPKTKDRYKYPFGKGGEVYLSALRAIRSRASQQGASVVFDAAGRLLDAATKKQDAIPAAVERNVQMKWMPTLLEVKGLNEGERTIIGTASTADVDLVGDVVVPTGCKYSLPMPLLLGHRHDQVVGSVTYAKPNEKGIPFQAKIAKIDEPGRLKDRCDEAWQMVRANLCRGVSIGFTAIPEQMERLKSGGLKFNQWLWHELSLVVIPANQNATIDVIRSLDRQALAELNPIGLKQPRLETSRPSMPACAVPREVTEQSGVLKWINDFANAKEWKQELQDSTLRNVKDDANLSRLAAAKVRRRQPTGEITQAQIQFEAWELRRFW